MGLAQTGEGVMEHRTKTYPHDRPGNSFSAFEDRRNHAGRDQQAAGAPGSLVEAYLHDQEGLRRKHLPSKFELFKDMKPKQRLGRIQEKELRIAQPLLPS